METKENAIVRIKKVMDMYYDIVCSVVTGDIKALVVSGPPGVGKSYTVERIMKLSKMLYDKVGESFNYVIIKGYATPISVYKVLYKYRASGSIIVFDDSDGALFDEVALNIFKAALDTGSKRVLTWMSEGTALAKSGVPETYEFEGSVIFLTNIDFDDVKSVKLKPHLDAMKSRCHYIDLSIKTDADKMILIEQAILGGMLSDYDIDTDCILDYMNGNSGVLLEISLRMAKKLSDLCVAHPENWRDYADMTCVKR
jgi:hypothetical protein